MGAPARTRQIPSWVHPSPLPQPRGLHSLQGQRRPLFQGVEGHACASGFQMSTFHLQCVCVCGCVVAKSYPTLCNPMDCSLPGSPVRGILQARTLEWAATSSSRGSSWPRIEPTSPALAGRFLISEPPVKPLNLSLFPFCVSVHLYVFLFFPQLFWFVGG